MPEMLTIKQVLERLKAVHPDTHICEFSLRRWQKEGRFHSVTVGRKILISWASLVSFLNGGEKESESNV